ncbi:MAG: hypothetical protein IJT69_03035, partial [Clostridia bacterium]|nr:hypothetical protein [Clostridia bacterium]
DTKKVKLLCSEVRLTPSEAYRSEVCAKAQVADAGAICNIRRCFGTLVSLTAQHDNIICYPDRSGGITAYLMRNSELRNAE